MELLRPAILRIRYRVVCLLPCSMFEFLDGQHNSFLGSIQANPGLQAVAQEPA